MEDFFKKQEMIFLEKFMAGKKKFDPEESVKVISPGRLNIIGEHTDYNLGFSLPMAIDKHKYFTAVRNNSKKVKIFDNGFNEYYEFDLGHIKYDRSVKWSNYIKGVIDEYQKDGKQIDGFNLVIDSDLVSGAGLSSSAAMLLGTSLAIEGLFGFNSKKNKILGYCHDAENNFVRINNGFLDHFSVLFGKKDNAIFLNFKNLDYKYVPVSLQKYSFLVIDSKEERYLPETDYNKRRLECEQAVRFINHDTANNINSLSDLNIGFLGEIANKIDNILYRRVKHVVEENQRVARSVEILRSNKMSSLGELLVESHESLRDDYEVSTQKLDFIVESLLKTRGVLGARMMGAGFGGCLISLIEKNRLDGIVEKISDSYFKKFKIRPDFINCKSADGVHRIN